MVWLLIGAGLCIHFSAAFGTLFSGDSVLYAVISKSFAVSGNFLDIYVDGKDWLDKPHFPFWLSALSMKVFGLNAFAYRVPSLGLFAMSLVYTYKLAERLYSRDTALLAVLVLTYSLHIFISNNDVRAESMLIGLIMGGVYHFYRSANGAPIWHVAAGSLFCAASVMTKGPFVIIVFGSAIIGYLFGRGDVRAFFSMRWLLAAALLIIFISPELFALYRQFDMHPEKMILGATGVSGLRFFVWDTQFGRFFNSGPFRGTGSPAFYLHTILWAFAPWAAVGYAAFAWRMFDAVKRRPSREYLTVYGFFVMFAVFSASRFQLPYYINILYPFLAIIIADTVLSGRPARLLARRILWYSSYLFAALFIGAIVAMEFVFDGQAVIAAAFAAAFLAALGALVFKLERRLEFRAIYISAIAAGMFALYANQVFYPRLLTFQAGSEAAFFANENLPNSEIAYAPYDNLLQFYAEGNLRPAGAAEDEAAIADRGKTVFFVGDAFRAELDAGRIRYRVIKSFDDYRVTRLTSEFLNPRTRPASVDKRYLIVLE